MIYHLECIDDPCHALQQEEEGKIRAEEGEGGE
jgi:hypothetical protein